MILQSPIFSGSVQISGSITLNDGPISATANIVSASTITDTFTSATSKVVNHGFDTKNVFVQVYNTSDELINPGSITTTDVNNVTITFPTPVSGRVIVGKSGHLVSGSAIAQSVEFDNILNKPALVSGSLDFINITNKPALVSGSNIASASLAETAERVRAGSSGSRPTDYTNIETGSLWYNTDTGGLEVFTGVSASWWQSTGTVNSSTYIPVKATGGIVTTSGAYTYHTFTSSSNFTANTNNLSVEYVIIAGGGGGGGYGGGGGAGGVLASSDTLLSNTFTVTVGAGGAGATTNGVRGTSGQDSSFNSETAIRGGGGGQGPDVGLNGGSGGGSGYGNGAGGSGTVGQGYDGGGSAPNSDPYPCQGGGGAGGAGGTNPNIYTAGAGGVGTNTYSTWATATSTGISGYYAGGGGGGIARGNGYTNYPNFGGEGGTGGGGNGGWYGGVTVDGTAGTANTGGGGGAGGYNGTGGIGGQGGQGGSGLVIIRYLT